MKFSTVEMLPACDLAPHPKNPNTHPDGQKNLLKRNIQKTGVRHPLILSNLSGKIVAGHMRLEIYKELGMELIPVIRQEFADEREEYAFMVADNEIQKFSETDMEMVMDESERLEIEYADLGIELADEDLESEINHRQPKAEKAEGEDVDAPPENEKQEKEKGQEEKGQEEKGKEEEENNQKKDSSSRPEIQIVVGLTKDEYLKLQEFLKSESKTSLEEYVKEILKS